MRCYYLNIGHFYTQKTHWKGKLYKIFGAYTGLNFYPALVLNVCKLRFYKTGPTASERCIVKGIENTAVYFMSKEEEGNDQEKEHQKEFPTTKTEVGKID